MNRQFKTGDLALDREGRTVKIVNFSHEDGVDFAWVTYPNGDKLDDPNGRVAGTYDEPIWEHRVHDGKVIRSGGDYWNENDWVIEKGLQSLDSDDPIWEFRCADCGRMQEDVVRESDGVDRCEDCSKGRWNIRTPADAA